MEEIQGGHCPCSKIQGGQPTTLPPPCRAPGCIDRLKQDMKQNKIRPEWASERESWLEMIQDVNPTQ